MPGVERQQVILDLLKGLRGLDPLKQLFWTELNYQRVNQPLSRRGWSETAGNALAEDPLLFAAGGHDNQFQVVYARLNSDKLLLGLERPVVTTLLRNHPYGLFAISDASQQLWHFINVRADKDLEKRRLFRRITIGKDERLRTAAERIEMLDLASMSDLSPLRIQQQHDEAFDVEAVQKDFFKAFADLYHKVVADISKVPEVKAEAGRLAQLLLDRMLFLYFIQKKGWLDQKPDYLYSRFVTCWRQDPRGSSYYHSVLIPLFRCLSNADADTEGVGAVPFLNGGLFEESAKQSPTELLRLARVNVKNSTFKTIFEDLLERFNFTVTEDTPLDVEVAIDPEMLGKIFESLILQLEKEPDQDLRKLTGSYYTPRPIVHFMCQAALKEYLVGELAGQHDGEAASVREKTDELLSLPPADHMDDDQLCRLQELFTDSEAKSLRQSILNCRVCDPAVGSGAFPVGMLHEMVAVVGRLDVRLHGVQVLHRRNFDYDLKKQIIESCLYGVDIQEQAVRLCELRLWLSLVVDYEIESAKPFSQAIREVPSLPNLSYRIVRGDSLLERLFGHVVQLDEMAKDAKTRQLIDSIQADKQAYFREGRTEEKRRLELKILAKQADLADRLIEAKRMAMSTYQTNFLGEEEMKPKERRGKERREAQMEELADLKAKVGRAKGQLERMARQKQGANRGDPDLLRREYFHTGEAPTFMWRVDFAEVFAGGGFDIAIANPPYIRVHRLSADVKSLLWQHFHCFKAKADLYSCFIQRGIQHLKACGNICYICSDGWQRLDSYDILRDFVLASCDPRFLLDLRFSVFEEAKVKVSVFQFRRRLERRDRFPIVSAAAIDSAAELGDIQWTQIPVAHFLSSYGHIFDTSWSEEGEAVSQRLWERARKLGDVLDVSFGLKTGDDSRFLTMKRLDKFHHPLLRGENVSRWQIDWAGEYVNYRPAEMRAHRSTARPGERERFECEKVLVRDTGNVLECALDTKGYYVKDVLIVRSLDGSIPPAYTAGIINSALMRWYYQRKFPTLHVQADELRSLPFVHPKEAGTLARRLADVACQCQVCESDEKSDRLQEQLNALAFQIYGIAEEEAKMILRDIRTPDEDLQG